MKPSIEVTSHVVIDSFDFKTVKINNGLMEPLSLLVRLSNYILRSVVIYFKQTPIEYLTLL